MEGRMAAQYLLSLQYSLFAAPSKSEAPKFNEIKVHEPTLTVDSHMSAVNGGS